MSVLETPRVKWVLTKWLKLLSARNGNNYVNLLASEDNEQISARVNDWNTQCDEWLSSITVRRN